MYYLIIYATEYVLYFSKRKVRLQMEEELIN